VKPHQKRKPRGRKSKGIEPYEPGLFRKVAIFREVWGKRNTMKEKLNSRKAWFVLAMNIGLLIGTAFGLSDDFVLGLFLWLNTNYLGFQGLADATKSVTGYSPPDMSPVDKLKSRKFWVGLIASALSLVAIHFGISEEIAGEIIRWISTAYLGSQAITDASGSIGQRLAWGKVPEPGRTGLQ